LQEYIRVWNALEAITKEQSPSRMAAKLPQVLQTVMMYVYTRLDANSRWVDGWVPFGLWFERCEHAEQIRHLTKMHKAVSRSSGTEKGSQNGNAIGIYDMFSDPCERVQGRRFLANTVLQLYEAFVC
jgi:hypothetical protein